ncbi:hypothetical protein K9L63_01310 [Candidatus Gracilibacteria bacterium]|nr:hypothetical protein [Candidatus Gracilibacteria bacterium]
METKDRANLTVSSIFSRFLIGFASGFIGSIVLGIVLFFSWSVVGDILSPSDVSPTEFGITIGSQTHPLFLSIITLGVFLAALVGNIAYALLSTIIEEKYTQRSTVITHIFFGNLVILLLILPVYLTSSRAFGPTGIALSSILHLIVTAFLTFLVLEILHQSKYLLVNTYGIILGILLFFFLGGILVGQSNGTLVLILSLPLLLGMIALGNRAVEVFYSWMYENYGRDFLNTDTKFGSDYGEKEDPSQDFDV